MKVHEIINALEKYKHMEAIADYCNHEEIDIDFELLAKAVDEAVGLLVFVASSREMVKTARFDESRAVYEKNKIGQALCDLVAAIPFNPDLHDEVQYLAISNATNLLEEFANDNLNDRTERFLAEMNRGE